MTLQPHLVVTPSDGGSGSESAGPHIYYAGVKDCFQELLMQRLLGV